MVMLSGLSFLKMLVQLQLQALIVHKPLELGVKGGIGETVRMKTTYNGLIDLMGEKPDGEEEYE